MTTLTGIALEDPNTFSGLVEKFNINYTTIDGAPQDKDFKYAYVSILSKDLYIYFDIY